MAMQSCAALTRVTASVFYIRTPTYLFYIHANVVPNEYGQINKRANNQYL